MPDLQNLFDRSAKAAGAAAYWTTRAARLMVGVPDYETYVAHRRAKHPNEPIMSYRGVLPRTPASPLRRRQGPVPRLLLVGCGRLPERRGPSRHEVSQVRTLTWDAQQLG